MCSFVRSAACAALLLLVHAGAALPQSASSSRGHRSVFIADVFASADSTPVADAEVLIPELSREAHTDFSGEATIQDVPGGSFRVVVRKIGYVSADLTIRISRDTVRFEFVLGAGVRTLDTVTTTAQIRDERLRDFRNRRAMGTGRFLDDSVLVSEMTQPVADIMARHFPGIEVVGDGRRVARRMCVSPTGVPLMGGPLAVYIDGVRMTSRRGPDATDLRAINGRDVAGIELYDAETAPVQYRELGQSCGVLLIWLRR